MASGLWRGEIGDEVQAGRIVRAAAGSLLVVSLISLAYSAGMSIWALGAVASRVELIDLPTVVFAGLLAVWLLRTRSRLAAFAVFLAEGLLGMLHVVKAIQPLTALSRMPNSPQFLSAFALSDGLALVIATVWIVSTYLAWRAVDAADILRERTEDRGISE